ncbi:hypothetical protein HYV79_00085 [Candidatus Woesearchaeota archaeon]|nr:hypothetical protein [Candidatus Woesearchaeota archaeon]
MSYVTLIIIHENYIYTINSHYTKIITLLKNDIKRILSSVSKKSSLDGGYILLDLNKKQIINAQDCFSVEMFVKDDVLNL